MTDGDRATPHNPPPPTDGKRATGLVALWRCCHGSQIAGVLAVALPLAVLVWYFIWGRELQTQAMQRSLSGSTQTLISVVDVFNCCILTWKSLTVMLPAFVLAGAVTALTPTTVMMRYLGAGSKRPVAYSVAALSGMVLSLCSCNIVPLFVSIYRRGAGLGPAFTFLFAGPAINIMAAVFTIQVIGWRVGIWRIIGVPIIAIAVGSTMSWLFRGQSTAAPQTAKLAILEEEHERHGRLWVLLVLLLVVVIYGAWDGLWVHETNEVGLTTLKPTLFVWGLLPLSALALGWLLRNFDRDEIKALGHETWNIFKLIVPIMLPAVLIIGFVAAKVDVKLIYHLVGSAPENTGLLGQMRPILLADVFGDLMYFPILTEVAFTKAFLKLGMGVGPALAILLAGPGTSLPGTIIIAKAIGWKRAITFECLVMLFTGIYAYLFASEIGEYICSCMMTH